MQSRNVGGRLPSGCRPPAPLHRRLALQLAITAGWLYGKIVRLIHFRRRLRSVQFGPLTMRVPLTWGEFEAAPEGDFVLRSVPTQYFIYGDSLWYASVAEIRTRPADHPGRLPEDSPMDELRRIVLTEQGPVLVLLRVARGMSAAMRAEAEQAFRSIRTRAGGPPLEFPEASYGVPALGDGKPPVDSRKYFEGRTVGP
jgi:hypothetical protein